MIVIDQGQAIVIDTPVDDDASVQLIEWIENEMHLEIVAIVPTHFHVDCLGGLGAFHQKEIPSYACNQTIDLAKTINLILPQNGFIEERTFKIGRTTVICKYLGEGHTKDNIVCYFPDEGVLFGGCLIKSMGAKRGNLADANVDEWSNTVRKVKLKYPIANIIIPGHGMIGSMKLLDSTIKMFDSNDE
jgi:metallo-beta-lactamase class B